MCEAEEGLHDPGGHVLQVARMRTFSLDKDPESSHSNRCNTQDYIWHKGMRCESIITDFQVMCVAVGSAALVLLLLFMMTVFFAKKLYLLKTENTKLRRTNKFRTPSELHNDNFSLSTIAEGSHPNKSDLVIVKILCTDSEDSYHLMMKWSPGRCFSHRSDC